MLDSESYKFLDVDIIFDKVKVIVEHFKDLLLTNNCCFHHLKEQLEILFDHIHRCFKIFCRKMLANYFSHWWQFGNSKFVAHSRDISCCSVIQCRVRETLLTFVAHFFQKNVNHWNMTLEILLNIGLDNDQSKERYGDAVELFLNEYPHGTIRKKKCHLQGHVYQSNQVLLKKHCHDAASSLLIISSDEESE